MHFLVGSEIIWLTQTSRPIKCLIILKVIDKDGDNKISHRQIKLKLKYRRILKENDVKIDAFPISADLFSFTDDYSRTM